MFPGIFLESYLWISWARRAMYGELFRIPKDGRQDLGGVTSYVRFKLEGKIYGTFVN